MYSSLKLLHFHVYSEINVDISNVPCNFQKRNDNATSRFNNQEI